jgi:hypothetical protein
MAYSWYDASGWLALGPNIGAWRVTKRYLRGPALMELVEEGATERLDELVAEADALLKAGLPPLPDEIVRDIRRQARRADAVLILSLSTGLDDEAEEAAFRLRGLRRVRRPARSRRKAR